MSTRALVLTGQDLEDWRARFRSGAAPAALPYEVDALAGAGYTVEARGARAARSTKLRDLVEHRLGYSAAVPLRAAAAAARSDVVVALLEREGALPSVLKSRHVPPYARRPLVIWSCWLADDLAGADAERRRALLQRYRSADLIVHLSRHETPTLVEAGFAESQLFAMTYGVSHDYYAPVADQPRDIELLSVGQDRGRDYATLLDAVRGTDLTLDVVCRPENLAGLDVPSNVRVHGPVPHADYRALLRRARVVAVPTHVRTYPTGSSVALEAASTGCCVVATDTPAMADYLRDGETAALVPVGDTDAWRATLTRLRDDQATREVLGDAARDTVETRFNARHMWTEIGEVVRQRGLV